MSTCNINILALSGVCQVSARVAAQLPAANDMYSQITFSFGDNITSHHC